MNKQNVSTSSDITTQLLSTLPRHSHPPLRSRLEAIRRVYVDHQSMGFAKSLANVSLSQLNLDLAVVM
jgi:hypothetical protein